MHAKYLSVLVIMMKLCASANGVGSGKGVLHEFNVSKWGYKLNQHGLQKSEPRFWPPTTKESRFLSLFTVVTFPNGGCAGASGDNGTCMTARECSARGGSANGYCANGFGLCCIFMTSCGSTTAENGTYFVNAGYPSAYDGSGSCELTVIKSHPDVCQIRLDFDRFSIAGPEHVNHVCNQDQFIVSGGNPVPAICGINQGNHMYIDAGIGTTNPVKLTFVTSGNAYERMWKVKVTQIPCSTIYKADEGCLQYYTGVSGQLKSFNYDPASGLQLSNQDYGICIRMERNFCGIQYTSCPDTVNNRTRAFTISGNSNTPVNSMVGSGAGPNACAYDWLLVPCAANVGRLQPAQALCTDRICGGTFSADLSMTPASVLSTVKPFRLWFHTDSVEAPVDVDNRGFCLNYVQQPCTNNLVDNIFKLTKLARVARYSDTTTMVIEAAEDMDTESKTCGKILVVLSWILVVMTMPFSLFICFKVVQEYERAVIFRLGRLLSGGAKGPGIFFILPCIDTYARVDLRTRTYDIPPQEVLTKDSVTVSVDAVVYYRVFNATISIANVENAHHSTRLLAQTTLRNTMGTRPLHEILSERETLSGNMQISLDEATESWGIKVERVEIKDVRLPVQLQRAMAAEAEAAREARAKVIAAEGEQKASRALREASEVIGDSPAALQLRYLQTLNTISAEKNSTIVFPLPIDLLTYFIKARDHQADNLA